MNEKSRFDDCPVIFSYSRAQAIDDGVLIDLTEWASDTGFRIPVASTAAVWNDCVVPPPSTKGLGQSERGRAHDLLWMLYLAIRQKQYAGSPDRVMFKVLFLEKPNKHETVKLKAICGSGDHREPVITIMLPSED